MSIFGAGEVDYNALPHISNPNGVPQTLLNITFGIAASVALLLVVINGFRYIIAHGDANQTASAKNGVLYAVVGLVVVMAAYSIVTLVVSRVG